MAGIRLARYAALASILVLAGMSPALAHHRAGHDRGPGGGGPPVSEPEGPEGPSDYIAMAPQLSQPNFPETIRESFDVPMPDGETLYVEVVRPDPGVYGDQPFPVVMEASPYHGTLADRDGTRIFPDPADAFGRLLGLTGYFAPRGYAVAMVDLRGTGRSTGCLDHLGQTDARDLKAVIEWLAGPERPWSAGEWNRVGMTGHSYVGSTPSVAAAQRPRGLATIVPSAGLASMYDHQFHKGVPWFLQWVGPMASYPMLSTERDLPSELPGVPVIGSGNTGDNSDNFPNTQTGCGWQSTALLAGTGELTGEYQLWHAERDWRDGATDADIPIFMVHGVNDNAARIPAAEWFFGERFGRSGDKVWLGQWDHGSTNGRCGDEEGARALHPTCRFDQFKYALHAWFDRHLKGMEVDTGPPVEVFLNGSAPVDVTEVIDPETLDAKVLTGDTWARPTAWTELWPDANDGSLRFDAPAEDGSASFSSGVNAVAEHEGNGSVTFASEPITEDRVFVGLPQMQLNASVTNSEIVHLIVSLFREDAEGNREPMNFCAIQPQLRHGVETLAPVVPLEEMALPLQCFTMAHWVPAGQRLVMEVSTTSPHHATFGVESNITVFTGPDKTHHRLPVSESPTLHDDVSLHEETVSPFPLGPAQPPVEGSVIVPVSGGGAIIEPLTAAGFEFDVLDGYDNATLEAHAVPSLPADLDLYLQQQLPDGSWSSSIAAGESGSLEEETLVAGRQPPGRYRILVHNWSGAPTDATVTVTFFNQDGDPGEGEASTPSATAIVEGTVMYQFAMVP